jgi:hypothetical protein
MASPEISTSTGLEGGKGSRPYAEWILGSLYGKFGSNRKFPLLSSPKLKASIEDIVLWIDENTLMHLLVNVLRVLKNA